MDEATRLQTVAELRELFQTTVADCADQILLKSELNTRIRESRDRLREALEPGSRGYRVFDRLSTEIGDHFVIIHDDHPRPYTEPRDCVFARKWLDLMSAVMDELVPSIAAIRHGNQYVLPAGDGYEAIRKVIRVLKLAERAVDVVDPYLDDVAFDLLEALDDKIMVRLLTGPTPKGVFVRLLNLLKAKRSNVEARSTSAFHDRFIILDESEAWQIGASLNGLGKATSMMNRVTADSERLRIIDAFKAAWANATGL